MTQQNQDYGGTPRHTAGHCLSQSQGWYLGLALIASIALVLIFQSSAEACSCMVSGIQGAVAGADLVFSGVVTKVESPGKKSGHDARFQEDPIIVTFQVKDQWKGDRKETVTLHTVWNAFSCDGYWFKKGESYLVFAHKRPVSGTPWEKLVHPDKEITGVSLCSGTSLLIDAAGWVKDLNAGRDQKPDDCQLFSSVLENRAEVVREGLNRGASPNAVNCAAPPGVRTSALKQAVTGRNIDITTILLDGGANVDMAELYQPWVDLIKNADWKMIDLLLLHGVDINYPQTRTEPRDIMDPFIRMGVGIPALQIAIQGGSLDTVEGLLKRGALLTTVNRPLAVAVAKDEEKSIAMLKFLLTKGVLVKGTQQDGLFALSNALSNALLHKAVRIAEFLLDHGVEVNPPAGATGSLLTQAASSGDVPTVELLLKRGADPNYIGYATALETAVQFAKFDIVMARLNGGANPNTRSRHGLPPLHIAASKENNTAMLQTLINHGAEVGYSVGTFESSYGDSEGTAAEYAARLGLQSNLAFLEEASRGLVSGHDLLAAAAMSGKVEIVQRYTAQGVKLDFENPKAAEAWTRVAERGFVDVMDALIRSGVDVNVLTKVSQSRNRSAEETALMAAARSGNPSWVQALLDRGARVNIRTSDGRTALTYALDYPRPDHAVVKLLLAAGADPNVTTQYGEPLIARLVTKTYPSTKDIDNAVLLLEAGAKPNPFKKDQTYISILAEKASSQQNRIKMLILAAKYGDRKAVDILLKRGVEVNGTDDTGKTALEWAKKLGHKAIVELLSRN